MRKFLRPLVNAASESIGSIRNMSVQYSQDDMINFGKKKAFIGFGKITSGLKPSIVESIKDGWTVDIVKQTAPSDPIDGVNYHTGGKVPEGKYDEIFIAVKPQQLSKITPAISKMADQKKTIVVSLLAGKKPKDLASTLGVEKVIWAMTNTNSATIGEDGRGNGQTAICTTGNIPEGNLDRISRGFDYMGGKEHLPAEMMDAFTAVVGSGPAYAHHLFGSTYRLLREKFDLNKAEARGIVLDVARNPISSSEYSDKVRDALAKLDTGTGSIEGIIFDAAKIFGEDCSRQEISCFVSGVVEKVSTSLIKGAQALGFSERVAESMISGPYGIIPGSALTALKTGESFLTLKNNVTSRGGTTQRGLEDIESGAGGRTIDELCMDGLKAATARGKQLGNPLETSLDDCIQNLSAASTESLRSVEQKMTTGYNALKQGIRKVAVSQDDSSIDYGKMTSTVTSPEAATLVTPALGRGGNSPN